MDDNIIYLHGPKDDPEPVGDSKAEPLAELLLELSDPGMKQKDGARRAQATARLIYVSGEEGERDVVSEKRFRFTAPLGPIEREDLRWYLESYYSWPTGVFKQRAEKIEGQLPEWGQDLFNAALDNKSARNVLSAWDNTKSKSRRRFTVSVDAELVEGTKSKKQAEANEAATLLLGLPWELLHDKRGYLFQGKKPVRVRRKLPNRISMDRTLAEPPIRILLVSPRPEDDSAPYIDHRASALPLVTALESLGDMAKLTVLSPPTYPALEEELSRADEAGTPYHVVHFDGHGIYRRDIGLGGLCFEDPRDKDKLEKRASQLKYADQLAQVTRDHRIPLVFLEACQTAQAEDDPTASVAAKLLEEGVASVVAMSHSVLVETARRFVEKFYLKLAEGARVGEAMLAGQRALKADTFRLNIFGAGRLDLEDWFVPVLYQEKEDLQLLTRIPSEDIKAIDKETLENRFGALPPTPPHRFVGRSRELLKLERLLEQKPYAVVCGQGGEGKTTLAAESARWLVRTRRFDQAVFVSVEDVYDVRTVVDQIGRQLLPKFSVAKFSDDDLFTEALQPIQRELKHRRTLLVLDNMESILPTDSDTPRFEPEALETFFNLCTQLLSVGGTRLLFTTREVLPEPFDTGFHRVVLSRLSKTDAVDLVHQAMTAAGKTPKEDDLGRTQPEVEALVEAVNCHARSLVLLVPYISEFGVRHTTENLGRLMAELHEQYPDERERSLFASVELSLRRLSPAMQDKIKPLGVFQGGGSIAIMAPVLELNKEEIVSLARDLIQTGLAEPMAYNFLRFHPALCPYLRRRIAEEELTRSTARWAESMLQLSGFLSQQQFKDAQLSATLTTLELPNLVRLLDHVRARENSEATVALATSLEQLLAQLGRRHLLARVTTVREAEAKKITGWSNAGFESSRMQIERLLGGGNFPLALQEARALLERCDQAGDGAYPEAAYDTAMAHILLGRVLRMGGASEAALQPINEALRRFQQLADRGDTSAARMASAALTETGDCLLSLGRLEEAALAYEEGIKIDENSERFRDVAVGKIQLGTVRKDQRRYDDALDAYKEALEIFENLGEPASVAVVWHQMGMVHENARRFEAAEQAYRQSLAIKVKQNNPAGEANSLDHLGLLYAKMNRLEESVIFHKKAADIRFTIKDLSAEGRSRNNLALRLIELKRYDEARREIKRAIECKEPYGHAATPWNAYKLLSDIEQAEGNHEAAAQARERAIELYLAYRRDGGENHFPGGRLCYDFLQALQTNQTTEMAALLSELSGHPETLPSLKPLIPKLQAILAGSRDLKLAEDPELDFDDAAEIVVIMEKLVAGSS